MTVMTLAQMMPQQISDPLFHRLFALCRFRCRMRLPQENQAAESLALLFGVFLLVTLVTTIFFWQWVPYLNSALIGPPEDNMQDFWNTWYTVVARNPAHFFFTDLIQFPEGTPLYFHSFAYPKLFAIALLSIFFGTNTTSLILLQNLGLLISFPLAGTGAFYLVRYLTANTAGALLGGFLFAFNPSHVEHVMHHAGVSSIEFIPLFVLTYLLTIERKSWQFLLLSIILYAINALFCWYYLFYIAYFIAFHTLYVAIRDRALPRGWQLLVPVGCLAGVVSGLLPILVPMVRATIAGASVYAGGSDFYVADVFAYPAFPRFHFLAPVATGIYRRLTGNEQEATVYLGFVNLAVLAGLCLAARRKDARLLIYVLSGMATFSVFASGNWLHVLGHRIIPMPDDALSHLPFFRNVRASSRAIVFVYMFLAIGIGQATALAWRYRSRHVARWGMTGVAALAVLDFFPAHRLAMTSVACSSGLAVIRNDPEKNFGVLDLPKARRGDYDINGNFYMLQQAACHARPIVQGNISRNVAVSLRDHLESLDLQAERRQLIAAKVKYIIINRDNMGLLFHWYPEDGPKGRYPLNFPTVYDGADLTVLRVY
jgi:hypothetical protein